MMDDKKWFRPTENLNNVEELKGYADYLRDNENVLWRHLLVSGELLIKTNKVNSYYANMRTQYKLDMWDTELTSKNGVFKPFHDLLEQIQFLFMVKLIFLII